MGAERKKYYPKLTSPFSTIEHYSDMYNDTMNIIQGRDIDKNVNFSELNNIIKELLNYYNNDYKLFNKTNRELSNRELIKELIDLIIHPKNIYSEDGIIVYFVETENFIFYTKKNRLFYQDKFNDEKKYLEKINKNRLCWETLLDEMSREEFLDHISKYVFPSKLVE